MLDEKQNLKIKTLLGSVFVQGNKILDDSFPCWDLTLPKKKGFYTHFLGRCDDDKKNIFWDYTSLKKP